MPTSQKSHAWPSFSAILIGQMVFSGLCFSTLAAYANPIIAELGITQTEFITGSSLLGLANLVGTLLYYGPLEKKLGLRKLFLIGGLGCALGCALLATAGSLVHFYAGIIVTGLSMCLVSNNTIMVGLNYWFKRNIGKLAGIIQASESLFGTLMTNVVGWIIIAIGWRYGWWLSAVLAVLASVVCFILYKGSPEELGESPMFADALQEGEAETKKAKINRNVFQLGEPVPKTFKSAKYWLALVCFLLGGVGCYAILANITLMCAYHGMADMAPTIYSASLISALVAKLVVGAIVDRFGVQWGVLCALGPVILGGLIMLMPSPSLGMLILASVLIGIGLAHPASVMPVLVPMLSGTADYSKKVGYGNAVQSAGCTLAPIIFTAIFEGTGSYVVPCAFAFVCGALCIILAFIGTKTKYAQ